VDFLKSLVKTLESVQNILEKYPELELQDNLAEQAKAMKNAIKAFEKKIEKYHLSLGAETNRREVKRIPREVQFALSIDVKELRVAVTQPFLILVIWINQQTP
jgi:DNA-binding transcriptional regulator GbsR (MarR family)